MKSRINSVWLQRAMRLIIIALIVKGVMIVAALFLPDGGVDAVPYDSESIYAGYKPSKILGLKRVQRAAKVKQPVYKLDRLRLRGIYDDPYTPFIAVEEGKEVVLVSKGEDFNGYKLIEVHAYSAVFSKNGRNYEVRFKEEKAAVQKSITAATPEVINEGQAVFVKRTELVHYAKNYEDIWKNIKIKEQFKGKQLTGFEVTWVKKNSVFDKIGLEAKDVIVGANNKRFTSFSQVFKLYNNINKTDSLKLTILRDNQEKELEYEIFE